MVLSDQHKSTSRREQGDADPRSQCLEPPCFCVASAALAAGGVRAEGAAGAARRCCYLVGDSQRACRRE